MMRYLKKRIHDSLRFLTMPRCTPDELFADLRELGVRENAVLLVHSSLSAMGYVPGGPIAVIESIRRAIGPEGTLVFPAHSWLWMNRGTRTFDVRETSVCVGTIPNEFRKMPGVIRSLHPTHSVAAVGPVAADLIRDHQLADTPCGPGTPYHRLLERDGQILFIGVGLTSNTVFHTIEALCGLDYLLNDTPDDFEIIDDKGLHSNVKMRLHRQGVPRRFEELTASLEASGVLRKGRVGAAESLLINGMSFLTVMLDFIQEQPGIFLRSQNQ